MARLRTAISYSCISLAAVCALVAASLFAFFSVFNASAIEKVLEERDIYSKVVSSIISATKTVEVQNKIGDIPLNEPWVLDIANKAFDQSTVKTATTVILDGTFRWLEGKTPSPDFRVDLSSNKQLLADGVGEYVTTRSQNLPICTFRDLQNLPPEISVYSSPCRPSFISPGQAGQIARTQVLTNQDILKDPVLNPSSVNQSTNSSIFDTLSPLRTLLSNKGAFLGGFIALSLAFAVLGVVLAKSRSVGLKRVSRSLLVAALSIAITMGFSMLFIRQMTQSNSGNQFFNDIVSPSVSGLTQIMINSYLIAFVVVLTLSGVCYGLYRFQK